ncbi:Trypsin, partial [Oryctes borbonicus]
GNKSFLSGQRPTKAIKLASKNPDYLMGEVARVSGWGICNNCGGVLIPGQLRSAEIQIWTHELCRQRFKGFPLDDRIFCGGVQGKQVGLFNNRGGPDAGSPLVIGDELVGLFLTSTQYFYPGEPGIYLNVAMFKS